jgi:hypothetical protein
VARDSKQQRRSHRRHSWPPERGGVRASAQSASVVREPYTFAISVLAANDSPAIVTAEVVIALSAVASFLYTLAQIKPAKKAAKTAEDAAKAAEAQAETARESAATAVQSLETEQCRLAQEREAFSVAIRPLIVDTPLRNPTSDLKLAEKMKRWTSPSAPPDELNIYWFRDNEPTNDGLQMEVRNIAGMPAFVHSVGLLVDAAPLEKGMAFLDRKVIAPQETARFEYQLPHFWREEAVGQFRDAVLHDRCSIEIRYTDLPGHQRILSRVSVTGQSDHTLRVTKLEMFLCDANWKPALPPFATTDPA